MSDERVSLGDRDWRTWTPTLGNRARRLVLDQLRSWIDDGIHDVSEHAVANESTGRRRDVPKPDVDLALQLSRGPTRVTDEERHTAGASVPGPVVLGGNP